MDYLKRFIKPKLTLFLFILALIITSYLVTPFFSKSTKAAYPGYNPPASASATSCSNIQITWGVTGGFYQDWSHFRIWRSENGGSYVSLTGGNLIGRNYGNNIQTYNDSVTAGGNYIYRIDAFDYINNVGGLKVGEEFTSLVTVPLCATPPPTPPPGPSSPSVNNPTTSCSGSNPQIDLSWSNPTSYTGSLSYTVTREEQGGSISPPQSVGSQTSVTDTSVTTGTSYRYKVTVTDSVGSTDGTTSNGTAWTPYLTAANCFVGSPPGNFLVVGSSYCGANIPVNYINWGPASGATHYFWERWGGPSNRPTYIGWDSTGASAVGGDPLATEWYNTDLTEGNRGVVDGWDYTYKITAYNQYGGTVGNVNIGGGYITVTTKDCQQPLVLLEVNSSGQNTITVNSGEIYNLTWLTLHAYPNNNCTASTSAGGPSSFNGSRPNNKLASNAEPVTAPTVSTQTTYTHTLSCDNDNVGIGGQKTGQDVLTVTVNPFFGTPPPSTISCLASPNPSSTGQTVTWDATITGPMATNPSVTYTWSGAVTGSTKSVSTSYASANTYNATVSATDGVNTITSPTCSVVITSTPQPLSVSCSAVTTATPLQARWSANPGGGNGNTITYSWFGDVDLAGSSGNPVIINHSSSGVKTGNVVASQAGSASATSPNCSVNIPPAPTISPSPTPSVDNRPVIIPPNFTSPCYTPSTWNANVTARIVDTDATGVDISSVIFTVISNNNPANSKSYPPPPISVISDQYTATIPSSDLINLMGSATIDTFTLNIFASDTAIPPNAAVIATTSFNFNRISCIQPFFSTSGGDVHSNESISQP